MANQSQQPKAQQPKGQQPLGFDPSRFPALLQDLQNLVQTGEPFAVDLAKAVSDLVATFTGKQQMQAQAALSVQCGANGTQDADECCCCVIDLQVKALAAAIQCHHCCAKKP